MKKENLALAVVSAVLVIIFVYSLFFSTPTYTVTFNSDGGSAVESVRVKKNKTVTKPATPTKKGYKFVSWQVDGTDFDFTAPITTDLKLTAKWEAEKEESTDKKTTKKTTTTTKKATTKKSSKKKK